MLSLTAKHDDDRRALYNALHSWELDGSEVTHWGSEDAV